MSGGAETRLGLETAPEIRASGAVSVRGRTARLRSSSHSRPDGGRFTGPAASLPEGGPDDGTAMSDKAFRFTFR